MNYDHFLEEFDTYNEWNQLKKKDEYKFPQFQSNQRSLAKGDKIKLSELEGKHARNDMWLEINDGMPGAPKDDRVNHPSHYTSGKAEAIDIIEDAIKDAPTVAEGMLQAQVLKYILRCWLKDNPTEDLKKAQWYLTRLIEKSTASEE